MHTVETVFLDAEIGPPSGQKRRPTGREADLRCECETELKIVQSSHSAKVSSIWSLALWIENPCVGGSVPPLGAHACSVLKVIAYRANNPKVKPKEVIN